MPSITRRADGRFEIRESAWTPKGPRSKTLAIFRELSPEVLDHAETRSSRPLDRDALVARARELGVHVKRVLGTDEPMRVASRVRSDELWPAQITALRSVIDELPGAPLPHHLEAMIDWLGVGPDRRARALVDLLRLADAITRARERMRDSGSAGKTRARRVR